MVCGGAPRDGIRQLLRVQAHQLPDISRAPTAIHSAVAVGHVPHATQPLAPTRGQQHGNGTSCGTTGEAKKPAEIQSRFELIKENRASN